MATGKASGNTVVTAAATKPSYDQNKAAHWHKPVGGFIFCFGLPQLTFQPSEARRKLDTHAHQTPESFTMKTLLGFTLAVLLLSFVHHGQSQELNQTDLRAANDAWHDGRYADALRGYQRLLNSAAGEQFLEPIALQTGELFQTTELITDGRNPKLSPDGKLIAFETGPAKASVTRIVAVSNPSTTLAELPGTNAALAPNGRKIVYLKLPLSEELNQAQAAVDKAQGPARAAAQQTLTRLQAKLAQLIVRDLTTQQERELPTNDLLKSAPVFAAEGETVFFVGAAESQTNRNDIYAIAPNAAQPVVLTDADGFKTSPVVDPSGKVLLVAIPGAHPFPAPRPASNNPGNPGGEAGQGGQGRGGGGGGAPARGARDPGRHGARRLLRA